MVPLLCGTWLSGVHCTTKESPLPHSITRSVGVKFILFPSKGFLCYNRCTLAVPKWHLYSLENFLLRNVNTPFFTFPLTLRYQFSMVVYTGVTDSLTTWLIVSTLLTYLFLPIKVPQTRPVPFELHEFHLYTSFIHS